jgi:hypothetical protein
MRVRNPNVNTPLINPATGVINTEWLRYFISISASGPNLEQRSGPPMSPAEGKSYYDFSLHKARTWDGAIWQNWW